MFRLFDFPTLECEIIPQAGICKKHIDNVRRHLHDLQQVR